MSIRFLSLVTLCTIAACRGPASTQVHTETAQQPLTVDVSHGAVSFDYAHLDFVPAGVAGDRDVVVVGSPLDGRVIALDRLGGNIVGELPPPPSGFVLPFIMKRIGPSRIAVLDAGGFPSPIPFVPANPTIYEYTVSLSHGVFTASLQRTISFASVLIGFSEDFVRLDDGRYVVSDAVLGSLWIANTDGSIQPGIVPRTFNPADAIPQLVFCPNMPTIEVGGIPFLFTASAIPGVSPLAARDGKLYFFSPCARGLYSVPIASLSDARPPHRRAADIRIVSPTKSNVAVEQLLAITFNTFDDDDCSLYAADSLQLRIVRIDVRNGQRKVVADNPTLFNFPSSMAFLPPLIGISTLAVVSNQQHRLTLTNDAITEDLVQPPFLVTKVLTDD